METNQIKIVLRFSDGTVGIMSFVTNDHREFKRQATKEEIEKEITKSSIAFDKEKLPVLSWKIVDANDIPEDRTFRNALRYDGDFHYDMVHAREIHKNYLREIRAPLLTDLDTAYLRASETGDEKLKSEIVTKKQALRDVTKHQDIEQANTPEQLKKVLPDILEQPVEPDKSTEQNTGSITTE